MALPRATMTEADLALAKALSEFYGDPLGYVMFAFPWDRDPLIQMVELPSRFADRFSCKFGPDEWACDFLEEWGQDIRDRGFDGRNAVEPLRYATSSGHGIGKSTLTAWIIKFILDTRPFSKGMVTANTNDQLRTKTWAELGKWHRMAVTNSWFNYSLTRGNMSLVSKFYPESWRCDGVTCKEENAEAFQGLHAANATPFYVFDEASGIPDPIWEARAGGATDGEPMSFDFGNPTRNSGYFHENTSGKYKHRFKVRRIDSRTVKITNKQLIQEWKEDYGEDSDFFKVKCRGLPPSAGDLQFIPTRDVEMAQVRAVPETLDAPLVIGVDVARSLSGDESVIYPRIGMDARSFPVKRFIGLDGIQLAGHVIEMINEFARLGKTPAAIFIDATGGYGGSVADQLRALGYANVHEVFFGGGCIDDKKYRYKGDEMWGNMREAIRTRLALPPPGPTRGGRDVGNDLKDQLTQREYAFTLKGQIHLEPKKDMKERLGSDSSPDIADALALTFAMPVSPTIEAGPRNQRGMQVISDFDPFADGPPVPRRGVSAIRDQYGRLIVLGGD